MKKYSDNDFKFNQGKLYISIQHESNPLELPDTEKTIKDFLEINKVLHYFSYYEIYRQPLDISNSADKPTFYSAVTDEISSKSDQVLSLQISENVQSQFGFVATEGMLFQPGDYIVDIGKTIPVLMGAEYRDKFKLGDSFLADYLYSPFRFQVIGFLEHSSIISLSIGSINMDKYIILPSFVFEHLPRSETEYITQKIHLANRTSGLIQTDDEAFEEVWEQLSSFLYQTEVGRYSWTSSSIEKNFLMRGYDINLLFIFGLTLSIVLMFLELNLARRCFHDKLENNSYVTVAFVALTCVCIPSVISAFISSYILKMLGLTLNLPFYVLSVASSWIILTLYLGKVQRPKKT